MSKVWSPQANKGAYCFKTNKNRLKFHQFQVNEDTYRAEVPDPCGPLLALGKFDWVAKKLYGSVILK